MLAGRVDEKEIRRELDEIKKKVFHETNLRDWIVKVSYKGSNTLIEIKYVVSPEMVKAYEKERKGAKEESMYWS